MGERARELYLARTTPSQRLDAGLRLADDCVEARLDGLDIAEGSTPEERVRSRFRALRTVGS